MSEHVQRVRITNTNPFVIRDMHDGVPYAFFPGQPVVIPADAALHIFGFPGDEHDMQAHMARRWGWNTPAHYHNKPDDPDDGLVPWQRLVSRVHIQQENYELRRVRDPKDPIPAEEADEAPDMLELREDKPPPRRVVGRSKRPLKRNRRAPQRARPVKEVAVAPQPEPQERLIMDPTPTTE